MFKSRGMERKFEGNEALNLFENKTKKRKLEIYNRDIIKDTGLRGSILCLPGPDLTDHVEQYLPLLDLTSKLFLVEIDKDIINSNNMIEMCKKFNKNQVKFHNTNILNVFHRPYIKNKSDFILFDFDFCTSAVTLIYKENFISKFRDLLGTQLFNKNGFFISLTVCKRADSYKDWQKLITEIPKSGAVKDIIIQDMIVKTYKDKNGVAMVNYLFYFKKNHSYKKEIIQNKLNFERRNIKLLDLNNIDFDSKLEKDLVTFCYSIENERIRVNNFSSKNYISYEEKLLKKLEVLAEKIKSTDSNNILCLKLFIDNNLKKCHKHINDITAIFEESSYLLSDVKHIKFIDEHNENKIKITFEFRNNYCSTYQYMKKIKNNEIIR